MVIVLTPEQRAELAEGKPWPALPLVIDPHPHACYVLVPHDTYQRALAHFVEAQDDRFVPDLYNHVMDVFAHAGWQSCAMDLYADLDSRRSVDVQRGDVVLVNFRFRAGGASHLRPAVVVQNEHDNQRSVNTIVAQIAIATRESLEPTQLLLDVASRAGQEAGLRQDCVVNCVNLLTLDKENIVRKLGSLPAPFMQKLDECLKLALGLM